MTSSSFQYTVLSGDTLLQIANEINACIGVTLQDVTAANSHLDINLINVGQVIEIPAIIPTRKGLSYTVRSGDTLAQILMNINGKSGITSEQIEQANPTINSTDLQAGELLTIPEVTAETGEGQATTPKPTTSTPDLTIENRGYWHWTYHKSTAPEGTTMGMAFFGATDPADALEKSKAVLPILKGDKYICLGGGTNAGRYTATVITKIIDAINNGDFADYDGIAYDVEVGESGLTRDFQNLFEATKAKGFKNLVTVSHSRPYGIRDGTALMRSFLIDKNIDFISPQLYTNGKETANQYTAYGVKWEEYAKAEGIVIPSIVKASYYEAARSYFKNRGVDLGGYVQWHQN